MLNNPIIEADSLTPDELGHKLIETKGALVLKKGSLYNANCYGSQIVLSALRPDRNGQRSSLHLETSAEFIQAFNARRPKAAAALVSY